MKFSRKIGLIVAAVAFALLNGCITYEPFEGEVIDKETSTYMQTIYPCGKMTCPTYIQNKSHKLQVRNQYKTETWSVLSTVYDSCAIGDRVVRIENGTVTCFNN